MRRYVATLFRLKELFLIPLITVPAIALIVTYYTGREYVVETKVWVDPSLLLNLNASSSTVRVTPSQAEATTLQERMSTEAFRLEVIRRSGLEQAIQEGLWPVPSKLGEQVAGVPVVSSIARAMGVVTPVGQEQAMDLALKMVETQVGISSEGNNLLVVNYTGTEPFLGKRLVEETLGYYNEIATERDVAESERGIQFYTAQAERQKELMDAAAEAERRFLEVYPEPLPPQRRPAAEQAELARLQSAANLERVFYEDALRKLESVRLTGQANIAERTDGFQVIDAPEVPAQPRLATKALILNMIVGLTLGGMISTAGVVLLTWTDRTVRTKEDVEESVSVPLVEQVPLLSGFSGKKSASVRTALTDILNPRESAALR